MFNFKKKDNEFFELFVDSAGYFRDCAVEMSKVMEDYKQAENKMKEIIDLEHRADEINDRIIDKLNQTFITPIDREDIYALANCLDDGVDFCQGTIQRVVLYHAGQPRTGAVELSQLLIEATGELVRAFELLQDIKKHNKEILDITRRISKLESEGDRVYRRDVAQLFESCISPIEVIKWKEILEYLENTLDHCEDIADLLRGVVMKYA